LPAEVDRVEFRMQFQRTPLHVSLDNDRLTLAVHREGASGPIAVAVGDQMRELCPGDTETFELSSPVGAGGHEGAR
jgi:hypothetical protein